MTRSPRNRASALTLIELLAVIVLMSLVAGLATIGLAAASDHARLRAAAADWRSLDAHARLLARSGEPIVMIVGEDTREIRLDSVESRLASLALPVGVDVEVAGERDDGPVTFDRLGHSRDYAVSLRLDGRQLGWKVYGLTGFVVETSP